MTNTHDTLWLKTTAPDIYKHVHMLV